MLFRGKKRPPAKTEDRLNFLGRGWRILLCQEPLLFFSAADETALRTILFTEKQFYTKCNTTVQISSNHVRRRRNRCPRN